jgi:hypothetical protein
VPTAELSASLHQCVRLSRLKRLKTLGKQAGQTSVSRDSVVRKRLKDFELLVF